jgi:hypothetical protein
MNTWIVVGRLDLPWILGNFWTYEDTFGTRSGYMDTFLGIIGYLDAFF